MLRGSHGRRSGIVTRRLREAGLTGLDEREAVGID